MTMEQCRALARAWSDDPCVIWLFTLELFYEDLEHQRKKEKEKTT